MERSDDFNAYRDMCANRLRRLERYKKARSFCSLQDDSSVQENTPQRHSEIPPTSAPPFCVEEPATSDRFFGVPDQENGPFEMIRQKMFALMENDMSLLQQLLNLGDQISEMKQKGLRRTQSTNSMDQTEDAELEDQFEVEGGFSASLSAVTNLYVDDSKPQYFSRQNSVLRIPIPPRSSNRFGGKKIPRRPSDALRGAQPARNLHINADDSASESSEGAVSPLSHTPSCVSSKSTMTYSSSNITYSSSNASDVPAQIVVKNRSSNSSIDSGIRESSESPSPTFEKAI